MDGTAFVDSVRDRMRTELDRLGSEKALVAATNADLGRERVLASAYAAERRAAATFDLWAADEPDAEARAAFERVAGRERDHADRVAALLTDPGAVDPSPDADALHALLRELDGTPERVAAGLVARPLVSARSLLQVVNFFVNEADESTADVFRDLRSETEDLIETGADLLERRCTHDDRERAETAAIETIERAYEEYAETLRGMGVDPEPVC